MKEDFVVSIIIPIYNQQDYLEASLKAVINQKYKNIEIIAVNDGSKDKSIDILQDFLQNEPRLKVINQENKGLVGATITGIKNSTGKYICFLDPDDIIGENFILNFVTELDDEYDFIAAGYYLDNSTSRICKNLSENRVYNEEELEQCREKFLVEKNAAIISNEFFISRWNKIYKRECVNKIVDELDQYKAVSLGEDTIFTFLIILNSKSAKVIKVANEYFYNISNENSMMKNRNIAPYITKCHIAFKSFSELLFKYKYSNRQAYFLFYFLIEVLFKELYNNDLEMFKKLYKVLSEDDIYINSIKYVSRAKKTFIKNMDINVRLFSKNPNIYLMCISKAKLLKKIFSGMVKDIKIIKNNIFKTKISSIKNKLKFERQRRNAFKDLQEKMPLLEERIVPYLNLYKEKKTNLSEYKLEKNIFVFWWDGFETAPQIVQECLKSVKKWYCDCEIIIIDKLNYQKYTNINPIIINDFEKGKISIQTFSDILRFNLLKNNGGMWIDSTIFFNEKCDLFKCLEKQPFSTLSFYSSKNFFNYKGYECSWSGYFIASHKESILVTAINDIFEKYYLEYKEYTLYFFIDAVLMLCKIHGIDDDVLSKPYYINGDMFLLIQLLDKPFDKFEFEKISRIPQKLTWFYETKSIPDSYYENIVKG